MSDSRLPATGGCFCGAVRYEVTEPPIRAGYCHCRMCQRALGNLFFASAGFPRNSGRWTKGQPTAFRTSDQAHRGFFSICGTPLIMQYDERAVVGFTVGSLDSLDDWSPDREIEYQYAIESMVSWCTIVDDLERYETSAKMQENATKGIPVSRSE